MGTAFSMQRITLHQLNRKTRGKGHRLSISELKRRALPWRSWYKSKQWRLRRREFLRNNPLCVDVFGFHDGALVPANVVDHKVPHKGDWDLFWDESGWQSMCESCHNHKTATEDGGFGNPLKNIINNKNTDKSHV